MTWLSQLWNVVVDAVLPDSGLATRVEIPEREAIRQEHGEVVAAAAATARAGSGGSAGGGAVPGGERD